MGNQGPEGPVGHRETGESRHSHHQHQHLLGAYWVPGVGGGLSTRRVISPPAVKLGEAPSPGEGSEAQEVLLQEGDGDQVRSKVDCAS